METLLETPAAGTAACEFPHVIPCTAETANQVWMMIRKEIMEIDPDHIFRSRKPAPYLETESLNQRAA